MKNPVLVAILIVNLLTCPLRCFACETQVTSSDISCCATFDCCEQCEEESEAEDPAQSPRDKECDCNDCICNGAIVENPAELPDPDPALIWMLPLYLESPLNFAVGEIVDPAEVTHSGQILSGRGARIAYQSLQI